MPNNTDKQIIAYLSKLITSVAEHGQALPSDEVKTSLETGFVRDSVRNYLQENPYLLQQIDSALSRTKEQSKDLLYMEHPRVDPLEIADIFAGIAELGVGHGMKDGLTIDDSPPKTRIKELLNEVPGIVAFQEVIKKGDHDKARQFIDNNTIDGLRKAGQERPEQYSERDRALINQFHRFLSDGASCANRQYNGKAYQILVDRIVCEKELPWSITSTTEDDVYWRCITEAKYEGGISFSTYVVSKPPHVFDSKEFSILLPDNSKEPRKHDLSGYSGAEPTEIKRSNARLAASSGPNGSEIWLPLVTPPTEGFPMGRKLISVDVKFRLLRGRESTLTDFFDMLAEVLGPVIKVGGVIAGLITANPLIPSATTVASEVMIALSKFLMVISGETELVNFDVSYSDKDLHYAFGGPGVQGFPGTTFKLTHVSNGEAVTDLEGDVTVYGSNIHQRFIGYSAGGQTFYGNTRSPEVSNDISHWYEVILRFERKPGPVQFGQ